ncbi:integral membrane protein [Dactylonectria macrodidyma]|uniref:Integral membrane protein n=1 Tax=Dactylonectria macrodidyma TaxID=307937 RepID=A0A9P9CWP0_9HYPO|nr:integral membrane protein [Dactylonectria macrodidyma]
MAGETNPSPLSTLKARLMAGLFGIAFYNTIEIFFLIFARFRRRRGRYFWSMVAAATGIPTHAIAFLLRYYQIASSAAMGAFSILGWCLMVTGQSVVLWSRLHLVVDNPVKIRLVLLMIIVNALALHIPETVIFVLMQTNPGPYLHVFHIYERVEIVVFSMQEAIISGLFLWDGYHSFQTLIALRGAQGRMIAAHLATLFFINILLDSVLIILEYTDHFDLETACKPLIYSIKLKVEFIILNQLAVFIRQTPALAFRVTDTVSNPHIQPPESNVTVDSRRVLSIR